MTFEDNERMLSVIRTILENPRGMLVLRICLKTPVLMYSMGTDKATGCTLMGLKVGAWNTDLSHSCLPLRGSYGLSLATFKKFFWRINSGFTVVILAVIGTRMGARITGMHLHTWLFFYI